MSDMFLERKEYIFNIKGFCINNPMSVASNSGTFKELLGDDAQSLPAAPDGIPDV